MFQRRHSRNGRYEFLIQVERVHNESGRGKHSAKIAQVIERATGVRMTQHPPLHEHYGDWPEDALDKAVKEGEQILLERVGLASTPSRELFERAPQASPTRAKLGPDRAPEWRVLMATPPNVLFEGAGDLTETFLGMLKPYLREPLQWTRPGSQLDFGGNQNGALVLPDVDMLDKEQQGRLNRWLQGPHPQRQIVSMATTPLFPLVERGLFDPALYYRLNMILFRV